MFFLLLPGVSRRTSATWPSSNTRPSLRIRMVSVVVCFMDSSAGYIMTSFNNLNDLWWGYSGTAGGASPCHDTGCQCFTSFSQKGCFTEREIQNTMSRLHRNDMMNDTCVFVRRRQTKSEIDLTIRSKSERGRDTDLQTGRDRQWLRHFFFGPAKKCPNSLFAASAPPLWATSKINGDHYRSHATQTLLVQPERSGLTPAPQTL